MGDCIISLSERACQRSNEGVQAMFLQDRPRGLLLSLQSHLLLVEGSRLLSDRHIIQVESFI